MLADGRHKTISILVDTNINHLKTGPLHHHRHQIFTNIVNIAFNRPDNHFADRWRAGFGQQGTQNGHTRFHSASRNEDFGHVDLVLLETGADIHHPLDKAFLEYVLDGNALVERFRRVIGADLMAYFQDEAYLQAGSEMRFKTLFDALMAQLKI